MPGFRRWQSIPPPAPDLADCLPRAHTLRPTCSHLPHARPRHVSYVASVPHRPPPPRSARSELSLLAQADRGALLDRMQKLRIILPALLEEAASAQRESTRLRLENRKLVRRIAALETNQLRTSADIAVNPPEVPALGLDRQQDYRHAAR